MRFSKTKTILAATALFSVLYSGQSPLFGQRLKSDPAENRQGARRMQNLQSAAYSDGRGALVVWQSASESNVVGYNIFRLGNKGLEQVNKSLVLGGGLAGDEEAKAGRSFRIFDPSGSYGTVYQIEVVSLAGGRFITSVASAYPVSDLVSVAGSTSEELSAAYKAADRDIETSRPIVPKTLAAETQGSLLAPNVDNQQWVAGQVAAKIAVRQDGIYRVLKTDLQAAGFDTSASPRFWRLFADGNEQAIRMAADGSFFEFYGRGRDTRESDTRIYYLVTGAVKGKRMASVSARAFADNTIGQSFSNSLVRKYRTSYFSTLLNGDAENYFGGLVSTTKADFPVTLPAVDTSQSSISLTVKLQGIVAGAHSVAVSVNGTSVGTMTGSNKDSYSRTFSVPMSAVVNGTNTVSLTANASAGDYSFIDTLSFSYARRFQAETNRLSFVTGSNKRVRVEGFTSSAVTVYDVTSPESPQIISNTVVESAAGGGFAANVITNRSRSMYAVQSGSALSPASITLNTPSTLSATSNQAKYLIVSHKNFMTEANAWAAYRAADGFVTKVVDIEDVFDEFSYGSMSTDGMNAFFSYAEYNWSLGPDYVLLVGDATYDYRGYEASPFANYVPTRLFDTLFEETGSDDALVDFNGDGLAEIPIGRVVARTTAQVTQLMQKSQTFEQTYATGLATRGALFAYDDIADPSYGTFFRDMSYSLANQLPAGTPKTMVYRYTSEDPLQPKVYNKTALMAGLNTGQFVVNYSGHGSITIWANNQFFNAADALGMTNGTNLTVFTMLTCLNGNFITLTGDNLAESLVKAPAGGAAAAWASSGKTTADVQSVMASRFYNKLGAGTIPRLGDLIKDSKTVVSGGRDVRLSWVLLGDPALKMR